MVPEERHPAALIAVMAALGTTGAFVAALLGHLAVARGIAVGASLAVVYLAVLWRYVRAFVARWSGRHVNLGDRIILAGGLPGRLLLAGAVLYGVAQNQAWINLWAAIAAFMSYRLLLAAYQIWVILTGRTEPIPPAIGWDSQDDRFTSREKSSIGRTRRWR